MTKEIDRKALWNKCVSFHGHECWGLTIGYLASLYAADLLGLSFSPDEELACISENDACGVDAVQVMLGCSAGKGNLMFHLTGKQAFSFYNRQNGKSVRLVLKDRLDNLKQGDPRSAYALIDPADFFDVKETKIPLPEYARIFDSYTCESCGEVAGSKWIRIQDGKKLCLDCCQNYSRFNV